MPSIALRTSWARVAILFVCSIPVVIVVAILATAAPFFLGQKDWLWYLVALLLFPGWLLAALIAPLLPPVGFPELRGIYFAFFANCAYWSVWIFWFVLWSDRRWRRKRAARIDA
jgi:hypothetical protein